MVTRDVSKDDSIVVVPLYGVSLPFVSNFPAVAELRYRKEVRQLFQLIDYVMTKGKLHLPEFDVVSTFKDSTDVLTRLKSPWALRKFLNNLPTTLEEKIILTYTAYPYKEVVDLLQVLYPNVVPPEFLEHAMSARLGIRLTSSSSSTTIYDRLKDDGRYLIRPLPHRANILAKLGKKTPNLPIDLGAALQAANLGPGALVFQHTPGKLAISYVSVTQTGSGIKSEFAKGVLGLPLYWNLMASSGTAGELDFVEKFFGTTGTDFDLGKTLFYNPNRAGTTLTHIPTILRKHRTSKNFRANAAYIGVVDDMEFLYSHLKTSTKQYMTGGSAAKTSRHTYHMLSPMQARAWLGSMFKDHMDEGAFQAVQDTIYYDDRSELIAGFDGLVCSSMSEFRLVGKRLNKTYSTKDIRVGVSVMVSENAPDHIKLAYPTDKIYTVKICDKRRKTLRLLENDHYGITLGWDDVEPI